MAQARTPLTIFQFLRVYSSAIKGDCILVEKIDSSAVKQIFESEPEAASILIGLVRHVACTSSKYIEDLFLLEHQSNRNGPRPSGQEVGEPPFEDTNWMNVLNLALPRLEASMSNREPLLHSIKQKQASLLSQMCSMIDFKIGKKSPHSSHHHAQLTAFYLSVLYHAKGEPIEMQQITEMANNYLETYFERDFPNETKKDSVSDYTIVLSDTVFSKELFKFPFAAPGTLMDSFGQYDVPKEDDSRSDPDLPKCRELLLLERKKCQLKKRMKHNVKKCKTVAKDLDKIDMEYIENEIRSELMKKVKLEIYELGEFVVQFAEQIKAEDPHALLREMKNAYNMVRNGSEVRFRYMDTSHQESGSVEMSPDLIYGSQSTSVGSGRQQQNDSAVNTDEIEQEDFNNQPRQHRRIKVTWEHLSATRPTFTSRNNIVSQSNEDAAANRKSDKLNKRSREGTSSSTAQITSVENKELGQPNNIDDDDQDTQDIGVLYPDTLLEEIPEVPQVEPRDLSKVTANVAGKETKSKSCARPMKSAQSPSDQSPLIQQILHQRKGRKLPSLAPPSTLPQGPPSKKARRIPFEQSNNKATEKE